MSIDPDNIFEGHDRGYIINGIITGRIEVSLPDVFYQLSPAERMLVLRKLRDGEISCDMELLLPRLTPPEREYLARGE